MNAATSTGPSGRITHLDAFRGLALLLVLFYHAFSRWSKLLPYGDAWAGFPLFKTGWVGVQLFFLISGFVILMTLERSQSAPDFLRRRWLRLFPAMLLATSLVFATAGFFHERPMGTPSWIGTLPGLLFIEPDWVAKLTGQRVDPLEGVFWSLYVEFKFYVFAALAYFFVRRDRFVPALGGLFLLHAGARVLAHFVHTDWTKLAFHLTEQLSFEHFGWFAAGAAWFRYSRTGQASWAWQGLMWSMANAVFRGEGHVAPTVATMLVSLLFGGTLLSSRMQHVFNIRWLQFMGAISYPLYLIHENMMLSWIVKLSPWLTWLPAALQPLSALLGLALVIGPAYVIAHHAEQPLRRWLDRWVPKPAVRHART